uniref:Putative secreted protein n=1 Tax=Ixodes ricinus TaxID=34613 RepID=A0A6B0U474_IXORI
MGMRHFFCFVYFFLGCTVWTAEMMLAEATLALVKRNFSGRSLCSVCRAVCPHLYTSCTGVLIHLKPACVLYAILFFLHYIVRPWFLSSLLWPPSA